MFTQEVIVAKANELQNNLGTVNKELKRVASVRCRLNKMPGRSDYALKIAEADEENELLKAVREYLAGPTKNVNTLTAEAIEDMDYDTVCKAIRSIQSKKTHTKWAEDCEKDEEGLYIPGSGAMYKEACRIEEMLKARREVLQPTKGSVLHLSNDENIAIRGIIDSAIEQYASSKGEIDYAGLGEFSVIVLQGLLDKLPEVTE